MPLLLAALLAAALQLMVVYTPGLQHLFGTVALSFTQLGLCIAAALVVLVSVEIEKQVRRVRESRSHPDATVDGPA